uniref:Uncharacterized protein n=1 Tax=Callorhinchus milii TaxID=7868 RepID=A0A4W3HZN1_CALMI
DADPNMDEVLSFDKGQLKNAETKDSIRVPTAEGKGTCAIHKSAPYPRVSLQQGLLNSCKSWAVLIISQASWDNSFTSGGL